MAPGGLLITRTGGLSIPLAPLAPRAAFPPFAPVLMQLHPKRRTPSPILRSILHPGWILYPLLPRSLQPLLATWADRLGWGLPLPIGSPPGSPGLGSGAGGVLASPASGQKSSPGLTAQQTAAEAEQNLNVALLGRGAKKGQEERLSVAACFLQAWGRGGVLLGGVRRQL